MTRDKWEYSTLTLSDRRFTNEENFRRLGREGWELVGFERGNAHFKRPLEKPVTKPQGPPPDCKPRRFDATHKPEGES